MLTGSIKKGVVKALEGVFEEELKTLEGWKTKIDDFMKKIAGILQPALNIISSVMEVIRTSTQIANMVKTAENAIEWGIRLAECSGVWSCLLILAEPFTDRLKDEAIYALKDKILSACGVRSLLGGAVRRLLFGVPVDIANGILNVAKDLASGAPKPVQTIFSQGVDREDPPELKEMEDNDCWGIDLGFSLFDEGFTHSKKKTSLRLPQRRRHQQQHRRLLQRRHQRHHQQRHRRPLRRRHQRHRQQRHRRPLQRRRQRLHQRRHPLLRRLRRQRRRPNSRLLPRRQSKVRPQPSGPGTRRHFKLYSLWKRNPRTTQNHFWNTPGTRNQQSTILAACATVTSSVRSGFLWICPTNGGLTHSPRRLSVCPGRWGIATVAVSTQNQLIYLERDLRRWGHLR